MIYQLTKKWISRWVDAVPFISDYAPLLRVVALL